MKNFNTSLILDILILVGIIVTLVISIVIGRTSTVFITLILLGIHGNSFYSRHFRK
ncbi:MAG: hypothetical protein GX222_00150 [Ruminococcaceae bacterium]|nr:hypothetical protein [Oscillospiraceae bacterium]